MKCSLGISNFLKEISSLSHSVVFLYLFALITEEAFLISPCCSLEPCIQMGISFLFSFAFSFSFFSGICRPPQTTFCLFAFLFHGDGLDPCLLYNVMNLEWKRRVKKLAKSSTFRKLRSWHLVPSLHGK